jgi:hypothetical protein
MRRALHFTLAMVGVVVWLALVLQATLLVALVWLGDRVWPKADMGDCWVFAITQWLRHGGHVRMRVERLGWLPIPRASWARPDGMVERAEPVRRLHTLREAWGGLLTVYFKYRPVTYSPFPTAKQQETGDTGPGDL